MICANCGQRKRIKHKTLQLCTACTSYWHKHGVMRPASIYNAKPFVQPSHCENCGRSDDTIRKGLCPACYMYKRYHGYDRPVVEQRLCDCGNPATETMQLATGAGLVEYHLCADCADLEREET